TFVPALDDLTLAEREGKRLVPVRRAIELVAFFAIDEQPTRIVDRHSLAGLRNRSCARLYIDDAQATGHGDLSGGRCGLNSQRYGAKGEENSGYEDMLKRHEASQIE